jgi:16S rRNA (cytosine1402-N4)-methyltransferase
MTYRHVSAMPGEVLTLLDPHPGAVVADCTLGGAGHARSICQHILPGGLFIGIDQDQAAIENAELILKPFGPGVRLFHGNFIRLSEFLSQLNIESIDGILLDLGLSLYQIESSGRGFSFKRDEPLDMRMDVSEHTTAADLVNRSSAQALGAIFTRYGEERWARRIANRIVEVRGQHPVRTSRQLADIVRAVVPRGHPGGPKIDPATRVFMALRIAVNKELERLETFLDLAPALLKPGGRVVVLSFHSLEDRIVKQRLKALAKGCTCPPHVPQCVCHKKPVMRLLTRKVLRPSPEEIADNPMARSTRLRAAEKL